MIAVWDEGIQMARTAYALDDAMRRGDVQRAGELASLLSRQVRDEVSAQAEAGGWYEEYDRATDPYARIAGALRDPGRDRQLQRLRREAGWRVSDMAEPLGISYRQYESYEKGETPIPSSAAEFIAARLGATLGKEDDMVEVAKAAAWKEKNVLIDRKGDDALVMRRLSDGNREFVVAHGYNDGTGHWNHGTYHDSISSAVADFEGRPSPASNEETFCTIRWMRDDIVDAIEQACGVQLDRNGPDAHEVESIIDRVVDEVSRGLDELSAQDGYETIIALMPDDAIERARAVAEREAARNKARIDALDRSASEIETDNGLVRNWYIREFPSDELGASIDPSLTFDAALMALPRGSSFYDGLGVRDSVVRERVFEELAERYGLAYDDVYSSWLNGKPIPGHGSHDEAGGVTLKGESLAARQASEQLSHAGPSRMDDLGER